MSNFRFELNTSGVAELLKSSEMYTVIQEATETVLGNTDGIGYDADVQVHNRVVGRVWADSKETIKDNYENNTLLKALHL